MGLPTWKSRGGASGRAAGQTAGRFGLRCGRVERSVGRPGERPEVRTLGRCALFGAPCAKGGRPEGLWCHPGDRRWQRRTAARAASGRVSAIASARERRHDARGGRCDGRHIKRHQGRRHAVLWESGVGSLGPPPRTSGGVQERRHAVRSAGRSELRASKRVPQSSETWCHTHIVLFSGESFFCNFARMSPTRARAPSGDGQ